MDIIAKSDFSEMLLCLSKLLYVQRNFLFFYQKISSL